jgi:hypothetical protein
VEPSISGVSVVLDVTAALSELQVDDREVWSYVTDGGMSHGIPGPRNSD